jgi:conjugative transfer region protein TrbK
MDVIRMAALAILGGVLLQTGFHVPASAQSTQSGQVVPKSALLQELERCKGLHEQAVTDARCQAAYKQSRDNFFGTPKPYEPIAVEVAPGVAQPKLVKPGTGPETPAK